MGAEIHRDEFQAYLCYFAMVVVGDWALDNQREKLAFDKLLELTVPIHVVFTIQVAEGVAFIRTDDPKLFPNSEEAPLVEDSTSGPECPDLELFVTPMGYNVFAPDSITAPAFGMHAVALRPTSLGTVRLRSNDPFDSPVIDPRSVGCPDTYPRY